MIQLFYEWKFTVSTRTGSMQAGCFEVSTPPGGTFSVSWRITRNCTEISMRNHAKIKFYHFYTHNSALLADVYDFRFLSGLQIKSLGSEAVKQFEPKTIFCLFFWNNQCSEDIFLTELSTIFFHAFYLFSLFLWRSLAFWSKTKCNTNVIRAQPNFKWEWSLQQFDSFDDSRV